jgi:hypothetical protein
MDISAEGLRARAVSDLVSSGAVVQTWGRKVRRIDTVGGWSVEDGDTLYIGDRKSGHYVRVYDKRLWGRDNVRFEVEYSNDWCKVLGKVLEVRGAAALFAMVADDWRAAFPCVDRWWLDALGIDGGERVTVGRAKHTVSSEQRREWLERSCMPSLVQCMGEYGLDWFWAAVDVARASVGHSDRASRS